MVAAVVAAIATPAIPISTQGHRLPVARASRAATAASRPPLNSMVSRLAGGHCCRRVASVPA